MPNSRHAWWPIVGAVTLRIRLTPKSSRDGIDGLEDTAEGRAIKARVRAVPEDGRANAALEALIADWLGVPRSAVTVSGGHKSRIKRLTVTGDTRALAERLAALIASADVTAEKSRD